MRYEAITGLTDGQLVELTARVHEIVGDLTSAGRPYALGLFRSVAMVVALMRKNITQEFAGAMFGISQPTVSRRWDLLRPAIGEALAEFVPDLRQAVGAGTVLVDGTICPTWDWKAIPDLFSGKAGYPGMNIQVATNLGGKLLAVGATPVHGARHDAHAYAYAASGLAAALADIHTVADLGYVGVEGIDLAPIRKPPGAELHDTQAEFNTQLSKIRAAVEHAIAHLTSKHGACSAKKAADTGRQSRSTPACSKPSPDYSSSPLMNKPPGAGNVARPCPPRHRRCRCHPCKVSAITATYSSGTLRC